MNISTQRRRCLVAALAVTASLAVRVADAAPVGLTVLVDNGTQTVAAAKALAADFMAQNPNVKIEIEARPGGTEGDNLVKTRLATGEMADVFLYNSGSLFAALNAKRNLLDLTDEPWQAQVVDTFKSVVKDGGRIYGAPIQTAMGGGILYNKKIYAKLNLQVPKTWEQFQKNNAAVKAAGLVPVIQTFKDTWSSQLFVLGDFYNVQAADPTFAERYTQNKAKYTTSPAAIKGFKRQEEVYSAGYLNKDFGSATYNDGVRMVARGEGAHYPMLTMAIATLSLDHKDYVNDVGFFALPGDDAAKYGLTVWMPPALYIPKSTAHPAEARKFVAFVASPAGCAAQTRAVGVMGPYMVKGCELPSNVPPAVADLARYFEPGSSTGLALEFLSPVKGPSLEQITVEVGSGIRKADDAAKLYDEDVRKQAMQLGIPGWK